MRKSVLEEKLTNYVDSDYIPFHMPGHKRSKEYAILNDVNRYDITEIAGFDNYHHATGLLKEEFDKAAKIYGSDKSYYLVNGCSVGILASISACFKEGDLILMARNCHKSVYNAVYLNRLKPIYIYPRLDNNTGIYAGISVDEVLQSLTIYKDIKGIIITSPTYEGVVSDIAKISEIAHKSGIPLIIDEAHGAHFHFSKHFPSAALTQGADIVIEGLHKTLPSLTQTAIMHIKSEIVDKNLLDRYVSMYQTTSPSYLFLSSISSAIQKSLDQEAFDKYFEKLTLLHDRLKSGFKNLVLETTDDKSKLIISTVNTNIDGNELARYLKENKIEIEMASLRYVVLMTSFCDDYRHYDILSKVLLDLDGSLTQYKSDKMTFKDLKNTCLLSPFDSMNLPNEPMYYKECEGQISAEYVYVYPPGIPIIVPGEVYDKNVIEAIDNYMLGGHEVIGLIDDKNAVVIKGR